MNLKKDSRGYAFCSKRKSYSELRRYPANTWVWNFRFCRSLSFAERGIEIAHHLSALSLRMRGEIAVSTAVGDGTLRG